MKTILIVLVVLGAMAGGAVYFTKHRPVEVATEYQTEAVTRGDLETIIGATGTVEPEEVVDIGAQVMGMVEEFGIDPQDSTKFIDYGSVVEKGTILAKIDPTAYQASLEQAEAALDRSRADLLQLEAKCDQAEQDWKRAESLRNIASIEGSGNRRIKAIADSDYDSAQADYKAAKANLAVGRASIRQNEAALRMARTNLGYTTIKSPVKGTILDRRVNIGQTVVASLNAPSLFLIAKDLHRMQVWASVNEADIGRLQVGRPVQFTVDAFPTETFHGKVTQIRLNATMTQNVVTYTVVVTTDNSSGKLLPYLTANVQFVVDRRPQVLLVPNAALRWNPPAKYSEKRGAESLPNMATVHDSPGRGRLWTVGNGKNLKPLEVSVGASNGISTEVSGGEIREGLKVIVGDESKEGLDGTDALDGDNTSNPFLPKLPKGSKPPPGPI
ncbi:MAG: efflux RND transporter periplasmic adaptor subunit [Planctomycetes bacterium]|nr:efflux RND transporter periplasmic adaptor subunit [Planctomycetota bacterium]